VEKKRNHNEPNDLPDMCAVVCGPQAKEFYSQAFACEAFVGKRPAKLSATLIILFPFVAQPPLEVLSFEESSPNSNVNKDSA